ncbi:MAG: monovalent cation/H+ antiporter complex subunit F [Melioribacteraceae bacterium]|nr:monovalent cation/H+ antiporter complex subunit F [Melioribacteraceae bacterium]RJP60637.1 MAG: pH regulation protein F [Ignavibacteriales bacterium]WKZ69523.1 MAG: monovalent cation/H+ antiporter complex subunit F [Melioribacteraceae bacterium]
MESFFIAMAIGLTIIITIPFFRVIKGPTVFDRLLGAGAIGTKTLVLILLLGHLFGRLDMFIDIALAYSILNFISSLIIAKYFSTEKAKE